MSIYPSGVKSQGQASGFPDNQTLLATDANLISDKIETLETGKKNKFAFSTETVDFSPSALVDGSYVNVDSATDVTVTFDSGALANDGDVVYFEQIGAGRILFANGTATITAAPSLALVSGGIGSIQAVIRKSATTYTLTGVTE